MAAPPKISPPPPSTTATAFLNYSSHYSCNDTQISDEKLLYSIFMIFLLLLSLLGNSIVLLAVCCSRSLAERPTFHFISSLGRFYYYYPKFVNVYNNICN